MEHVAIQEEDSSSPLPGPRLAISTPGRETDPSKPDVGPDTDRIVADDQQLMQRMIQCFRDDPRLAEELAREGQQRFPDSPNSDDRDMYLVLALFNQQKMDQASREAYSYLLLHPNGKHREYMSHLAGGSPP